jgi:type I restriction enzyme M protein
MRSDGSEDVAAWTEWDRRLLSMEETSSRYMFGAFKERLGLLGLVYLQRRDRLSFSDAARDTLGGLQTLAEAIEEKAGLHGGPLSEHLLSDLRNIEPKTLDNWLQIASESWPIDGFAKWFSAKLDELPFVQHHDTPSSLARLVVSLLPHRSPNAVLDPACGTGGFLAAVASKFKQASLIGREISSEAWAWANLRFLIDDLKNVELTLDSHLRDETFARRIPTGGIDFVLTNPPFGMESTAMSLTSRRLHGRIGKLSSRLSSEAAYIQEIVDHLSRSGLAAVLVPNGFLSRGGADQKLREALVQADAVQAVINLPERLFAPGTTIETAILLLSRQKPSDQKERTLFVDARRLGQRQGVRMVLDDNSSDRIRTRFNDWSDEEGFSRVVSFGGLDHTSASLSPARYVVSTPLLAPMSPNERRSRIAELDAHYSELCREYEELRLRLDYSSSCVSRPGS